MTSMVETLDEISPPATRHRGIQTFARLWAAVVGLACAVIQLCYLHPGGFFLDDFRNLGQARSWGFIHLLGTPIGGEHFQPGGRLAGWLVGVPFNESYFSAILLLSVAVGGATYCLARLLAELFGPTRFHLLLAFLFGSSWIYISTDQWFAGADPTFSLFFTLAACLWYVRWYHSGRSWHYAISLASAAAAVVFWEQALAIPGWFFLLWLFFFRGQVRRTLMSLIPFVGISVAFTAYVQSQPWHQPLTLPTIGQFIGMTAAMLFHGLFPTIIGAGWGLTNQGWELVSVVLAPLLLAAGAAYLIAIRRFRFRAVGFFVGGTLVVASTIAVTRVNIIGASAGTTSRYITVMPFVLAVTCAGAISRERARRATRPRPVITPLALVVVVVLIPLYLLNVTATYHRVWFGQRAGQGAMAIAGQIGHQIDHTHVSPTSWVDTPMPYPVWYPGAGSAFGMISSYWSTAIEAVGKGDKLVGVDPEGVARNVRFRLSDAPAATSGFYVRLRVAAGEPGSLSVTATSSTGSVVTTLWVNREATTFVLPTGATRRADAHVMVTSPRRVSQAPGILVFGAPTVP
jgi:hypothetical protein